MKSLPQATFYMGETI